MRISIRSDIHARVELAERQLEQTGQSDYLFDLGDVEVRQIGRHHPLRAGQAVNESTLDAILRNSIQAGRLTADGKRLITDVFADIETMQALLSKNTQPYRSIAGNSEEGMTKVFSAIAPGRVDELKSAFSRFDYMREARAEFVSDSALYQADGVTRSPEAGIIYLPWKASMKSVRAAVEELSRYDLPRIIILSHDYLTHSSIDDAIVRDMRKFENEEQVLHVLDNISPDARIQGYFGHIGMQYGNFQKVFNHRGKRIETHHADEKDGTLLFVEV